MSRIIDVSVPIAAGMITWPGDPAVVVNPTSRIRDGGHANVSQMHLGTHTGTHVDPPFHFVEGGSTVELMPLDVLYGPVVVADLQMVTETITAGDLEALRLPDSTTRILFKTRNSAIWSGPAEFPESYVALSPQGADWIVQHGIRLVGIDFLSIEKRGSPGHPTHLRLLEAGTVVIEGLDLRKAEPGIYTLACLPLKVAGGDGAPARAILIK